MEALGRVELPTNGLGNRCSIRLSRVLLDKDEGFVKGVVILGGAQAPLFCSSAREVLWKRS